MSSVDMCEHDWPGTGCKECKQESYDRKKKYPSEEWVLQKNLFNMWCEKKGYFPHTKYFEAWLAALEENNVK